MSRWRVAVGGVGAIVTVALLRAGAQFIRWRQFAHSPWPFLQGNLAVALFWLPIVLAVDHVWRTLRPERGRRAVLSVIGLTVLLVEPWWTVTMMASAGIRFDPYPQQLWSRLDTNLLFYLAIIGITWLGARRRQHCAYVQAAAELDAEVSGTELHVLTLQLHPHFLFNTLNLISQLAFSEPGPARRVIRALRELVSRSLACGARTLVPVREEWRFLESYVDIQRLRLRDRLDIELTLDPNAAAAAVPHLLLQPLIENAIVHGVASRTSGGSIAITGRRVDARVWIDVTDDGPGVSPHTADGRGLANTRLRMRSAYGEAASLTLTRGSAGGTNVRLDFPFQEWHVAADEAPRDAPDVMSFSDATWRRLPRTPTIVLGWAAVAAVWYGLVTRVSPDAGGNLGVLLSNAAGAALWALLTPVVMVAAQRFDLSERFAARTVAVHGVLAVAVATAHVMAWFALLWLALPAAFAAQWGSVFAWWLWNVVAYGAMVAFTTVTVLGDRTFHQQLAMARQRAILAKARTESHRLRFQPGLLLRGLDAIESLVGCDADRAERAIACFGDMLRGLLAATEGDVIDAADEMKVMTAFYEVLAINRADRPRHAGATHGRMPAMVTAPLLAVLRGAIVSLDTVSDERGFRLEARASGAVDRPGLEQLSRRVATLTNGSGRIHIREGPSDAITAQLWVPWLTADVA